MDAAASPGGGGGGARARDDTAGPVAALGAFQAILRQADERYPGARLLEAELDDDDGEFIYEIELLTGDGVVRELEIDARTGRVLEDEVDD